jgi:hypothetical protein
MIAMQNGEIILSEIGAFTKSGTNNHMTSSLNQDSHVDVMVVLQGMGENSPFLGPAGDTLEVKIVPEFENIVSIVLSVGMILAIVLQKTKSRLN